MYSAKVIENLNPSGWEKLRVGVFKGEEQIGEYERNYSLMSTFHPFQKDSKWYALYSPSYTSTRVMELPSCKDLGGEESTSGGFCPVEYYVPQDSEEDDYLNPGHWGFVQGCHWGDDSSWKLQWLDLSKVEEGIIKREARFGYIRLPAGKLKDLIVIDDYRKLSDKMGDAVDSIHNHVTFYIPEQRMFMLGRDEKVKSNYHPDKWTRNVDKYGWGQVWPEVSNGKKES